MRDNTITYKLQKPWLFQECNFKADYDGEGKIYFFWKCMVCKGNMNSFEINPFTGKSIHSISSICPLCHQAVLTMKAQGVGEIDIYNLSITDLREAINKSKYYLKVKHKHEER